MSNTGNVAVLVPCTQETVSGQIPFDFRSRLHFFKASAFCGEQNFKKPILSLFVRLGVMSQ